MRRLKTARFDPVSLAGGTAIAALGAVLALDQLEVVGLGAALTAAVICAAVGAIAVASGLYQGAGPSPGWAPRRSAAAGGSAAAGAPLRRDTANGLLGGVVAGVATRFGGDPLVLRGLTAVATVFSGGLLLVGYAVAWALVPASGSAEVAGSRAFGGTPRGRGLHLGAGVGLITLAILLVFRQLGIWWSDALVWPLVLAAAGAAPLWGRSRPAPEPVAVLAVPPERADAHSSPEREAALDLYRGGFGIALVIGAGLLFLSSNDALGGTRDALFTAIVAIFALALILAPFIWRLGRSLADERTERIRSQERAEMAAHLHDSVLQTLTLLQKRSGDPREVSALARRQERELRAWLEGVDPASAGFAAALRRVAEEVEDDQRVKIDVVAVGDCDLDEPATAVVAAAREALINAAKFAGTAGPISLYSEVDPDRIEVFVRDHGAGFDPESIDPDRRGVRESINGRMRRRGGAAMIRGVAGSGTEVQLTIARSRS